MRWLPILSLAAALGFGSAFLVACGDRNGLIPPSAASAVKSDLDKASSLVDAQECRRAQAAVGDAQATAADLPSSVDGALRTTLSDNVQQVLSDVRTECGKTTTPTQTTNTNTVTTQTQTTNTQPTTTETAPTTTTTEPTPPPTTTSSPSPNGGGNNGGTPAGGGRSGSRGGGSGSGGSSP
jgi:hypothetical protein